MQKPTPIFRVWIFFISSQYNQLWQRPSWNKVFDAVDPLVRSASSPGSLNLLQVSTRKGERPNPGTLLWNRKNMERWTHDHANLPKSANWTFHSLSAQWPTQTDCIEKPKAPDIFLRLVNLNRNSDSKLPESKIDQIFRLVIRESFFQSNGKLITETIQNLVGAIKPCFSIELQSPWYYIYEGKYFHKSLDDLYQYAMLAPNWHQNATLDESIVDQSSGRITIIRSQLGPSQPL